jgi:hypothetical protein
LVKDDRARSLLDGVYRRAGFTLEDVPLKRAQTDYSPRALELEATFRVLSQAGLPDGTIRTLSKVSHIPKPT